MKLFIIYTDRSFRMFMLFAVAAACFSLQGCILNFSPDYAPPVMPQSVPEGYKEEKVDGWKTANPSEALERGPWWEMFRDPALNGLMERATAANQNIAAAAANLRQAAAQANVARSALLPGVSASGSAAQGNSGAGAAASYSVGVSASWEVSFWNSLPAYEAAKAQAEATAADYATMRLSVQAEVAQNYFQLRIYDVQHELYESTIAAYAKAVQLTRSQYSGGMVTLADVAQAEAQLAAAEAQLASIERQRAALEHALATLTGQLPSHFTLEPGRLEATLPTVPLGLPSALLERRPDVAAAERRVAAANQQIGVARGAWFPSLNFGADRILQGAWLQAPLTVWSLGPKAAMSIFSGGKNLAQTDAAWAGAEAAAANYRQSVLNAFKEVEDNLAALSALAKEAEAQGRAVQASQMALRLSLSQYRGGMTTYLQVVNTQTAALTNERNAIDVEGRRLITAVNLIKALGGGWSAADLQNEPGSE